MAVEFNGKPDELVLLDELVKLTGYDKIDLAVIDHASPVLRASALVGVALFEATPGRFAETQMEALAEYRDTAPLRRLRDSLETQG